MFNNLDEEEDGQLPWCNMVFDIAEKEFDNDSGTWRFEFVADADPIGIVGFGAKVSTAGWTEQIDDVDGDPFHSYWGRVDLISSGDKSDRLLKLLAGYYELEIPKNSVFAEEIGCLAVGIESDPSKLADTATYMKLFFDDDRENGHYAEVFFDIDLPNGLAFLNEKDEDFRSDLVHWLSLPGQVVADPFVRRGQGA